jgi:hypothetical protein
MQRYEHFKYFFITVLQGEQKNIIFSLRTDSENCTWGAAVLLKKIFASKLNEAKWDPRIS